MSSQGVCPVTMLRDTGQVGSLLNRIANDIYSLEDTASLAGMRIDLRTTIVRLRDGSLWVHSPTRLRKGVSEQVNALGPVRYLVAASNGHNRWLCDWQEAYPGATVYVARGIPKKLPALKKYRLLEEDANPPWAADLAQAFMGVAFFGEFAFLHHASRSLIVTDFIQNHSGEPQRGFGAVISKCMFEPMGFKGVCVPPPLKTRFVVKNPAALRRFVDEIMSWNVERLVVAHGPIIEEDPKGTLAALTQQLAL